MANKLTQLSWPERFALIDQYKPANDIVCSTFGLTNDELSTARNLLAAGTFSTSKTFDTVRYGNPFVATITQPSSKAKAIAKKQKAIATVPTPIVTKGGATVHTKPDAQPETATKKTKILQKRGRKGDKIQKALLAVPTSPTPVDSFMKQYNVSLAVLRQSKRFLSKMDPTVVKTIGTVKVRQDKNTKALMIWREEIK